MDDIPCTATVGDGEERPNILFTPPCACPRCAPDPVVRGRPDRNWLRLPGDRIRYRVEVVTLGALGRDVLGG
jgi:hypothetical protein